MSDRLQELCGYYSNRISYEEVAKLIERVSGERLLSDQKIGQIVSDKALKISQEIYKSVEETLDKTGLTLVKVNPEVDIYNSEEKEILLFDDGIQVKGQKDKRQPKAKLEQQLKEQNSLKSKTSAVITDVVLLQKATREFEYIAAPIDEAGQELIA